MALQIWLELLHEAVNLGNDVGERLLENIKEGAIVLSWVEFSQAISQSHWPRIPC